MFQRCSVTKIRRKVTSQPWFSKNILFNIEFKTEKLYIPIMVNFIKTLHTENHSGKSLQRKMFIAL